MSGMWPVQEGIVAALAADATFVTLAGPVFDSLAPRDYPVVNGARIGYVTMADSAEQDMRVFARKGYTDGETLNIFAATREDVKQIYAAIERVLNGPRIDLPGGTHVMLRSETRLIACTLDADGVTGRGVVRYDCITQAVA
jgi:hypothetical protein